MCVSIRTLLPSSHYLDMHIYYNLCHILSKHTEYGICVCIDIYGYVRIRVTLIHSFELILHLGHFN